VLYAYLRSGICAFRLGLAVLSKRLLIGYLRHLEASGCPTPNDVRGRHGFGCRGEAAMAVKD
jgi:hypothetical protein